LNEKKRRDGKERKRKRERESERARERVNVIAKRAENGG